MIYVLSGPETTAPGPMSIPSICAIAKEKGVPVFVDAAAEEPNKPNIHLAAGASLVGYSGGKCMRGPQSSGLLLGDKSLCKAAYYQAAPHHNYGRPLKCSKEEAMGMLAAVNEWYKRDHEAEQAEWTSWMHQIADRVKGLPSVTTKVEEVLPLSDPKVDLSNRCPGLIISWDANALKITGSELQARLDAGSPRIMLDSARGARPAQMKSSVGITSYMMEPGDVKIVADAIYEALTKPGHYEDPVVPTGATASIPGKWAVTVHYTRGTGEQHFDLQQNGNAITGDHTGEIYNGKLRGTVTADHVLDDERHACLGRAHRLHLQRHGSRQHHVRHRHHGRVRQRHMERNTSLATRGRRQSSACARKRQLFHQSTFGTCRCMAGHHGHFLNRFQGVSE